MVLSQNDSSPTPPLLALVSFIPRWPLQSWGEVTGYDALCCVAISDPRLRDAERTTHFCNAFWVMGLQVDVAKYECKDCQGALGSDRSNHWPVRSGTRSTHLPLWCDEFPDKNFTVTVWSGVEI